uniref:DUF6589 domain-containing protein n=1 Tax=Magallana gigas TaxID=29159 RepID=A0A8W8NTW2_MAGGI
MSGLHYCTAFLLVHGGCTQRDIQRLAKLGLCVSPGSVHNKLASWIDKLDEEIICLREEWAKGGQVKYQLVGDNWDKNIIPAFRTSQQKTLSLHLFNVVVVVDRIIPTFTREKTKQYPLGLFDTNETKTADMIQLLRDLQSRYVPFQNDEIVESVFFGGDRLTDERVQCAQQLSSSHEFLGGNLQTHL